jgi:DNA replication protein DnaC
LCNGAGVLITEQDGYTFAKNCTCTEREILRRKLTFANIPKAFEGVKVADFKASLYQDATQKNIAKTAKKAVLTYLGDFEKYKALGKGLYLYSHTKGTGKTMLALALANALLSHYHENVKFATLIDILEAIKATFDDPEKSRHDLLDAIKTVPVLVIDDIGAEKLSDWANSVIFQMLNERLVTKKVTHFTSNLGIHELRHDPRITERILSLAIPIQMPEESIRRRLSDLENSRLMHELITS